MPKKPFQPHVVRPGAFPVRIVDARGRAHADVPVRVATPGSIRKLLRLVRGHGIHEPSKAAASTETRTRAQLRRDVFGSIGTYDLDEARSSLADLMRRHG